MGLDIGDKRIGDTKTHIDFPYKCKHCGEYIKIDDRLPEDHKCTFRLDYLKKSDNKVKRKRQKTKLSFTKWLKSIFKK